MVVLSGVTRHWHLDQQALAVLHQATFVDPTFDLGVLSEPAVDGVLTSELSDVLVPPVGYEHGCVVRPRVAWCGAEQDPVILFGDLVERLDPCTSTHQTLLVEYEELAFVVHELVDLVPRGDLDVVHRDQQLGRFLLPRPGVANLCCCDNDDLTVRLFLQGIAKRGNRLACAYITPQHAAIVHLGQRLALVRMEFSLHYRP